MVPKHSPLRAGHEKGSSGSHLFFSFAAAKVGDRGSWRVMVVKILCEDVGQTGRSRVKVTLSIGSAVDSSADVSPVEVSLVAVGMLKVYSVNSEGRANPVVSASASVDERLSVAHGFEAKLVSLGSSTLVLFPGSPAAAMLARPRMKIEYATILTSNSS